MKANEILSARLIDLIFDDRNKDYGAYELRDTYPRRVKKAILLMFGILAVAIGSAKIASSVKTNSTTRPTETVVQLRDVIEKPEKLPEPEPKPEMKQPDPVREVKLTPPNIVPDEVFDKPMPTLDDIDSSIIGLRNIEGKPDTSFRVPPLEPAVGGGDPTGIIQPKPKSNEIETSVDVAAKFIGNWKRFLETNLNAETPVENGAGPGRYSVVIQFVVDEDGVVSDATALTSHGFGMEQEAIRVIKRSQKWEPAIKASFRVKAYHRQVIVFEVVD